MRLNLTRFAVIVFAAMVGARAFAAVAPGEALDMRLKALEQDLRCLVCQNQTLAESNAPLAEDLRKEVREQALTGKSDDEIRAYLVARYGDFVLYKPPVEPVTYLLWFGPFVLLVGGAIVWWMLLRRRARMPRESLPMADADLARARQMLED
ncbi:MAG TPA: cytochrome c-type biogenesis protein [Casimicrobiaceae bacterium]|nr:cytochrome c-type biogenesis protein [Casimicrobiaceae bacterium]